MVGNRTAWVRRPRVVRILSRRAKLGQGGDGILVANGGFEAASGHEAIRAGLADAVSFGVPFLANPDLPRRFALGARLNEPDPSTFYGGDAHGYTDYPTLDERGVAPDLAASA